MKDRLLNIISCILGGIVLIIYLAYLLSDPMKQVASSLGELQNLGDASSLDSLAKGLGGLGNSFGLYMDRYLMAPSLIALIVAVLVNGVSIILSFKGLFLFAAANYYLAFVLAPTHGFLLIPSAVLMTLVYFNHVNPGLMKHLSKQTSRFIEEQKDNLTQHEEKQEQEKAEREARYESQKAWEAENARNAQPRHEQDQGPTFERRPSDAQTSAASSDSYQQNASYRQGSANGNDSQAINYNQGTQSQEPNSFSDFQVDSGFSPSSDNMDNQ